jgi:heme oxygenase
MQAAAIPLHQLLRAHTASAHARVDAGLDGGLRDAHAYAAYLDGMAEFLDAAAAVIGDEAWLGEARRHLAIDRGQAVLPAARPRPRAAADPAQVAGWRYVVAGSTLGARLLLRDARALGPGAMRGTAFLASFSAGDAWVRCLAQLRAAAFDAASRQRACDAALDAFHAAEAALTRARIQSHAAA